MRCAQSKVMAELGSEVLGWLGSNALGSESLAGEALAGRPLVRKVMARERSMPEKHWPEWNWLGGAGFGGAGQKSADICPRASLGVRQEADRILLGCLAGRKRRAEVIQQRD